MKRRKEYVIDQMVLTAHIAKGYVVTSHTLGPGASTMDNVLAALIFGPRT